jgi:hypothetical protein
MKLRLQKRNSKNDKIEKIFQIYRQMATYLLGRESFGSSNRPAFYFYLTVDTEDAILCCWCLHFSSSKTFPTTLSNYKQFREDVYVQHIRQQPGRPRKNSDHGCNHWNCSNTVATRSYHHSTFKIYPPITDTTTSKIEDHSYIAKLIREASLIICDEATMMTRYALKALEKILRKIMKNNLPYGNKVVVLGGDFRQCLPVVKHATESNRLKRSLKIAQLGAI